MRVNLKVSVVIPLYNGEKVIRRALDSVFNQTFRVDEVIIVNDGSTDNSIETIQGYIIEKNVSSIRVINKDNGGVSSARNLGIEKAKNEYIAFLDCDDEWVKDKVDLQLKEIVGNDVVLVGGNHSPNRMNRISFRKIKADVNEVSLLDLLFKNYFQTSTVLIKKTTALKFEGFDEKQTHAEEGQFFYNMTAHGTLKHINKQLVIYDGGDKFGFGESGLSEDVVAMEKGEIKNLYFAYKNLNINLGIFLISLIFSVLKFIRRLLSLQLRKWKRKYVKII